MNNVITESLTVGQLRDLIANMRDDCKVVFWQTDGTHTDAVKLDHAHQNYGALHITVTE